MTMPYRPIIIAALQAAGLYLAWVLVPFLGQFAVLFVPVPLAVLTVLHGRAAGTAAIVVAAAIVASLGSWQTALVLFLLGFGLMARGLAEGILRDLRPETAIVLGSLLPLAALLVVFAPFLLKAGTDPVALIETYLRTSLADVKKLYTDMGITEAAQALDSVADILVFYLVRLLPGIVLATTLMQAAGCYGLVRVLALRKRPDLPLAARPGLSHWHAPDQWVWVLIAALGLVALAPRGSAAWFAGLNSAILFLLLYAAQGMAVLESFYRKARIPLLVRSLLHAFVLALPSVVAVVAFGVVDIWADFRKVRTAARTPEQR